MIVFRVEAEKPVHPFFYIQYNNTQTKLSTLILITLNALTMKNINLKS